VYISLCRQSQPSQRGRRIWIIDRHMEAIAFDMRDNLAEWLHRQRTTNIPQRQREALDLINESNADMEVLRREWEHQRSSQKSVRSCTLKYVRNDFI
jgi:hypothetical protein